MIKMVSLLLPIPFLFHFYEYNSYLEREEATLLFPLFLFFTIMTGVQLRRFRLIPALGINILMVILSLILGYLFIEDDGSWFKPFGRDGAILFIAIIYILGQLIIRWISQAFNKI